MELSTGSEITLEKAIRDVKRVSEEFCDGESPTWRDMVEHGIHHPETYQKNCDRKWNDILEEAELEKNQEWTPTEEIKEKLENNREEFYRLYYEENLKQSEIAEKIGVESTTLHYNLDYLGIEEWKSAHWRIIEDFDPEEAEECMRSVNFSSKRFRERMKEKGYPHVINRALLGNGFRDFCLDRRAEELAEKDYSALQAAREMGFSTAMIYDRYRDMFVDEKNERTFFETERGEQVKSAGEQAVADYLYAAGVDYEYEPELDDCNYVPDFRLPDGTLIEYWGLVGYEEYRESMKDKRWRYIELGYDFINVFPRHVERRKLDEAFGEKLDEF